MSCSILVRHAIARAGYVSFENRQFCYWRTAQPSRGGPGQRRSGGLQDAAAHSGIHSCSPPRYGCPERGGPAPSSPLSRSPQPAAGSAAIGSQCGRTPYDPPRPDHIQHRLIDVAAAYALSSAASSASAASRADVAGSRIHSGTTRVAMPQRTISGASAESSSAISQVSRSPGPVAVSR